jgi:hypothetical protein
MLMKLELVSKEDISEISTVWERNHRHSFELPSRKNLIVEAKVTSNGRIIGYGQVRHVAEPILILDLDARPREKIEALQLLFTEACRGVEKAGLSKLFCFIRDPKFADLMVKHFGLERTDPGEMLIRTL